MNSPTPWNLAFRFWRKFSHLAIGTKVGLANCIMKTRLTVLLSSALISAGSSAFAQEQPGEPTTVQPAVNTVIVVTPSAPTVVGGAPGNGNGAHGAPVSPPAPAAAAAPGISDPDISQLGGQLVPVGSQTEYRYSFRKTNISANPIGWLTGFYGLSLSHAVSNNVAIRGDITVIKNAFGSDSASGADISLSAVLYLRRTYLGPFIEPGVRVLSVGNEQCDYSYSQSGSGQPNCSNNQEMLVGPQVLIGYHYSYDSGFNFAVAGGLSRTLSSDSSSSGDEILPAGYVRFGYAF
jgi:hypothetical protein